MALTFGVHTGLQNTSVDDLRALWHRIEELGFDWISIWDHFYSADFNGYECLEAVACHAALACETRRVRWGSLADAAGSRPPPVQAELPIWVGGGGEKRTLAIVAKYADGWNVPFISPEDFARKRGVLASHCDAAGRDLGEIKCAVNVGLAFTDESLKTQFGALA